MAGALHVSAVPSRQDILALDAADELARFRDAFRFDDPDVVYVDGNSLGRLPYATAARLRELVDTWGSELVEAWEDWIDLPVRAGDALGTALLGARPGETLVCDSVTVNLHKLTRAALDGVEASRPVVAWRGDFPTDRYVVESLGRAVLWCDGTPEAAQVAALAAARPALVLCSLVDYRSGALADLAGVTAAAHDAGARVLWDLSHAVGAVAVDLPAAGADLAVGCTYKYLCAGPGAPAFLWVREDLADGLRSPLPGWFGQADQFAMGHGHVPATGVTRFLAGTPPILALAAVEPGVALLAEAGMDAVQAKGRALTALAVELHDAWLEPLGFALGSPRDAARRGAHVALRHPDAWPICRALIERARVVPDFRAPDVVRLGFPALTTRFADVWDALDRLRALVTAGEHERFAGAARRVT
jgi:kynureninase